MGYYVTTRDNVKIYVEDLNPQGKKAILFIHGWPGNHKLFEYQFDQLPKLGYRCIGIDTRGFGNSDKPFYGYDFNTLSDDLASVINALKLNDFILAGHSNGGAIAIRYMARYKGYGVSKLALFAAVAPSLIKRPNFPYGLDQETVLQLIKGTYTDRPKMLRDFGSTFFYQPVSEAFSDWFFQLGLQAAGWSTVAIANTWLNEVLFSDLETIHVPTVIIHGIYDRVVPYQLGVIQNQIIRNSKLIPFKQSGHASFYEQKDEFNEVLVKFIEG
jgi:non-heme chloroperoxidase